MKKLKKVFVANRGEIAVRIIRACRNRGIKTVIGVSEADRDSLGAQIADRAVCIGPANAAESYLKMSTIVVAASATACDAVHPGYGFLAERAAFQQLCADNGLVFIGPPASAIDSMGDKLKALSLAKRLGIPTVPGGRKATSIDQATEIGAELGYPLFLKASAGGGGRGMRIVRQPEQMRAAFETAGAEALAAFGNPELYLEKCIEKARHIEIQVLADTKGNVAHLGERDCSTQRRNQKLIEEAPSPAINDELRAKMAECAMKLAREVNYLGVGTVEFIYDVSDHKFYFLEMNTRIQVEHPVTEMITGVDVVSEQLAIAGGEAISFDPNEIKLQGHSIECRINAEIPNEDFRPAPGRILKWRPPTGEGVRLDTHCFEGYLVPPYYDSLLGKLIVHAVDREAAIKKMESALSTFEISGIYTTVNFHRSVLGHPDFKEARVTTNWVESQFVNSIGHSE